MGAFRGPNGNVVLVRNHEITNSPNTPAFGPGTPYDAQAGAGTTTVEVTPFGEVVGGLHEPERHDVQLQRRRDAVGLLDHAARRRSTVPTSGRTSPAPPTSRCRSRTATSSRCRPTARATASRSPRPDASRTRRSRSTRSTGSSTSPRTTSSSRRASTATSRRPTR